MRYKYFTIGCLLLFIVNSAHSFDQDIWDKAIKLTYEHYAHNKISYGLPPRSRHILQDNKSNPELEINALFDSYFMFPCNGKGGAGYNIISSSPNQPDPMVLHAVLTDRDLFVIENGKKRYNYHDGEKESQLMYIKVKTKVIRTTQEGRPIYEFMISEILDFSSEPSVIAACKNPLIQQQGK